MSAKPQMHNASPGASNDSRGEGLNAEYRVGYGRPPRHTQFRAGQVGNPKGRPRGSANARTVVERALNKQIKVRKGKKTRKISMLEALADTYAIKAVQGDRHAAGVLIGLAIKTEVVAHKRIRPSPVTALRLSLKLARATRWWRALIGPSSRGRASLSWRGLLR